MKYIHSKSLIQLDTRPVKKNSPKRAEPGLHPGPLNNTDNLSESVSIPRNSLHIRL
jgi:hypothetical protein